MGAGAGTSHTAMLLVTARSARFFSQKRYYFPQQNRGESLRSGSAIKNPRIDQSGDEGSVLLRLLTEKSGKKLFGQDNTAARPPANAGDGLFGFLFEQQRRMEDDEHRAGVMHQRADDRV